MISDVITCILVENAFQFDFFMSKSAIFIDQAKCSIIFLKNPNNSNKVVQSTYFLQVNPSITNVFYKLKKTYWKKLKEKTFIMKLLSQISDIYWINSLALEIFDTPFLFMFWFLFKNSIYYLWRSDTAQNFNYP